VRLEGERLVLREWRPEDVPRMTELFDDPIVKRWTPLASPFDVPAAQAYLERAGTRRRVGAALHLAITDGDDGPPLGEVLLFVHPDVAEVGWALGAAYRGQRLASRAVRVLLAWAGPAWGIPRFQALIEPGNTASERVAAACGFVPVRGTPVLVESRGRSVGLTAWHWTGDLMPEPAVRRSGDRAPVAGTAPGSG
jgi:RimJ/RimL family protein N-acetyltransferase